MKAIKNNILIIYLVTSLFAGLFYTSFLLFGNSTTSKVYDAISNSLDFVSNHKLPTDLKQCDSVYQSHDDLSISVFDNQGVVYWNSTSEKIIKYPIRIDKGRFVETIGRNQYLVEIRRSSANLYQFVIPLKKRYPFSSTYLSQPFSKYGEFYFELTSEETPISIGGEFLKITLAGGERFESWLVYPLLFFIGLSILLASSLILRFDYNKVLLIALALVVIALTKVLSGYFNDVNFIFDSSYFYFGFIKNYFELFVLLFLLGAISKRWSISQENKYQSVFYFISGGALLFFLTGVFYTVNNASSVFYDVSSSLFVSSPKVFFIVLVGLSFWVVYEFLNLFNKVTYTPYYWLLLLSVVAPLSGVYQVVLVVGVVILVLNVLKGIKLKHRVILSALLISVTVTVTIFVSGVAKVQFELEKFGNVLVSQQNIEKEFEISQVVKSIKNDPIVREGIINKRLKKARIKKKIKHEYLKDIISDFSVEIDIITYPRLEQFDQVLYLHRKGVEHSVETDFNSVFKFDVLSQPLSVNYYSILEYGDLGFIYLFFKGKQTELLDVVGRLKQDKPFERYRPSSDFDFEIWQDGELIFSKGKLRKSNFKSFENTNACREVYVAYNKSSWMTISMNFLFYLLLLLIPIIIVDLLFRFLRYVIYKERFLGDRIWLVITSSVVFPLSIFATVIILTINSKYKDDLLEENKTKIESLKRVLPEISSFPSLKEVTLIDFNLYNSKGDLEYTTQNALYQGRLSSTLLPFHLLFDRTSGGVIEEKLQIGEFGYTSLFDKVLIEGEEIWLEVPFFNSFEELNSQRITVLEIFLYILFGWMVFHYLVSNNLIRKISESLQNVATSIQKVDLNSNIDKIEYKENDEIKVIVQAYNHMIDELQESKEALTKSEKENAWREMAKQVAHEIKNPLTPMKLMLQHLQRKLQSHQDFNQMSGSVGGLINQVDTLSEIASSFSTFAQMPNPEIQQMDLVEILTSQINIFNSDHNVQIDFVTDQEEMLVAFDPKLFGRIVLNLLLNAKQSVPDDKEAFIKVHVFQEANKARLEVIDNGSGIEEGMETKVFLPNFTTKSTGSGIGLAVAKKGVEFVNGEIWFEDQSPTGTKFIITLPLK